jgi:hypothetical protein
MPSYWTFKPRKDTVIIQNSILSIIQNAMNKRRFSAKKNITVALTDYQLLEFHRQAVALLPYADDPRPGFAIIMPGKRPSTEKRNCTCSGLSESNFPMSKDLPQQGIIIAKNY